MARSNFFKHVAFHGGTSLRIIHGLDRFSEDLDFDRYDQNYAIDFERMAYYICNELESYGLKYEMDKVKTPDSNIWGCYIVGNMYETLKAMGFKEKVLKPVHPNTLLRVKIDIDLEMPDGYRLDHQYKSSPFHYGITLLDLPSLFAGKTAAVVGRHWISRIKGRDLYDFEWYIRNKVPINLEYFSNNLLRGGTIESPIKDKEALLSVLEKRFMAIDYDNALQDLYAFVPRENIPKGWCPEHFIELSKDILIKDYGSPE